MKKIILTFTAIIAAALIFTGGVFASQWLSFTGDNQISQSENDVNEIMEILRSVDDKRMTAEQALEELQALNPKDLAKQNKELREQVKQLENTNGQLVAQLEQKQAEIQEKIEEGNRKVAEKQGELNQVAQERDSHKQRADELQQQINESSNYVKHLEKELQRANEAVAAHGQTTTQAVEEARTYK